MFYGELFKKDDEEDIWEELRQMLLNPPSEQEITLKKQQEQAMIDATLERMFPTETKLLKEKSREELLQDSIKAKEKAVESSESLLKNEVKSRRAC